MKATHPLTLLAAAVSLAGCVTSNTMPVAANQVMIDTHAGGLLFAGQSGPQTMKKAAEATIAAGYDLFKLSGTQMGSNETLVPTESCSWGQYGGGCSAGAIPHQSERVQTLVTMFRRGEPASQDAFDARQVFAQYGGTS
jgi:hypothetical protein